MQYTTNEHLGQQLFQAIKDEDIEQVKKLVAQGADINAADQHQYRTPLMAAAQSGNCDLTLAILELGAEINTRLSDGSALSIAAKGFNDNIAGLLLEHGAAINVLDHFGETPLVNALERSKIDLAMTLLKRGADFNINNLEGDSPLIIALNEGFTEIVEFITNAQIANSPIINELDDSDLIFYTEEDNIDEDSQLSSDDMLVDNIDKTTSFRKSEEESTNQPSTSISNVFCLDLSDVRSDKMVYTAIIKTSETLYLAAKEAEKNSDIPNFTILVKQYYELITSIAKQSKDLPKITQFMESVRQSDFKNDETPLMVAAKNGCTDGIDIATLHNTVNDRIPYNSALTLAVKNNHYEMVKLLLKHGADIDALDWHFDTPLIIALENNNLAMAIILINRGANINANNIISGQSPLILLSNLGYSYSNIYELIIKELIHAINEANNKKYIELLHHEVDQLPDVNKNKAKELLEQELDQLSYYFNQQKLTQLLKQGPIPFLNNALLNNAIKNIPKSSQFNEQNILLESIRDNFQLTSNKKIKDQPLSWETVASNKDNSKTVFKSFNNALNNTPPKSSQFNEQNIPLKWIRYNSQIMSTKKMLNEVLSWERTQDDNIGQVIGSLQNEDKITSQITSNNDHNFSYLFSMINEEIISKINEIILEGNDINALDSQSMSLLHYACHKKNYEIIKFLLSQGAKFNVLNKYNQNPLHLLLEHKTESKQQKSSSSSKAIKISGNKPMSEEQATPKESIKKLKNKSVDLKELLNTISNNHSAEELDSIIYTKNHEGQTVASQAIINGLDLILDMKTKAKKIKSNPDKKIKISKTDNDEIDENDSTEFDDQFASDSPSPEKKIIINTNKRIDGDENTSLHVAAKAGSIEIVKKILKNCAQDFINLQNKNLQTPLHLAIIAGKYDVACILLKNKADIKIKDTFQKTPIEYIPIQNSDSDQNFYLLQTMIKNLDVKLDLAPLIEGSQTLYTFLEDKKESLAQKVRYYQSEALKKISIHLSQQLEEPDNQKQLFGYIKMATGSGKTEVFLNLLKQLSVKTLIIVPNKALADQTKDRLIKFLGQTQDQVGIIDSRLQDTGKKFTIIVDESFEQKYLEYSDVMESSLVIIDEAHTILSDNKKNVIDLLKQKQDRFVLGFTATDEFNTGRSENSHSKVSELLGQQLYTYSRKQGEQDGFLFQVATDTIRIDSLYDQASKIKARGNNQDSLSTLLGEREIAHDSVERIMQNSVIINQNDDKIKLPTVIFVPNIKAAEFLRNQFNEINPKGPHIAEAIHSGMNLDPKKIMESHQKEEFQFLINVDILTAGYDHPDMMRVFDFSPQDQK